MDLKELQFNLNKIIMHPDFEEAIKEVSSLDVSLPNFSPDFNYTSSELSFNNNELILPYGNIEKINLNPQNGYDNLETLNIAAYDESIAKFSSLEGTAFSTSHSMVFLTKEKYNPVNFITFYFYTKSNELTENYKYIKLSDDPEIDSKKDYIRDRILFLEKAVPENSLLFIDGPLIGGDVYTFMIRSIEKFHNKNIIPIFFVKNSSSNLVTDNLKEFSKRFNSDLHWSYKFLDPGQRTNFFIYRDRINHNNSKAFCYLKSFNNSPVRIEFHSSTFSKYKVHIEYIMDLIFYLLIAQGKTYNTQIRPIVIAELYARQTLNLFNILKIMKEAGITPTMNQERFGG